MLASLAGTCSRDKRCVVNIPIGRIQEAREVEQAALASAGYRQVIT